MTSLGDMLTESWQRQELQSLSPMKMAKPSRVTLKGMKKPSCGLCEMIMYTGNAHHRFLPSAVCGLETEKLNGFFVVLYMIAWLPFPSAVCHTSISLLNCNTTNTLSFRVTVVSPFESTDYPIPGFLCSCIHHFFRVINPPQGLCKPKETRLYLSFSFV